MMLARVNEAMPKSLSLYGQISSDMLAEFKLENEKVAPVMVDGKMFSVQLSGGGQLTFEPGAQLEYSTKPYPCLISCSREVFREAQHAI